MGDKTKCQNCGAEWPRAPAGYIHKCGKCGDIMSANSEALTASALSRQCGGDHYKKYKIQPVEYAMANNLNYCQANAVKYTTRYRDKGGIEDLKKAIHNLEILIELESNGKL